MPDPPESIAFGTDGWRGVIARDFTYANVARVAQAAADFLRSPERPELESYRRWGVQPVPAEQGVVIGYDTRFEARSFAAWVGCVLLSAGFNVTIAEAPVPSPALAYAVVAEHAALGLMVTASHNPPEYCGIKIKTELGSAAPPEITRAIEKRIPPQPPEPDAEESDLRWSDLKAPFLEKIRQLIDVELLREAPLRVIIDSMYGSARGYVADLLDDLQIPYVQIRGNSDPYFGGGQPEPIERHLYPLRAVLCSQAQRWRDGRLLLGVATDGDGDRVAGMDETGALIDAHRCYALIFRHLLAKGGTGRAIKSYALSDMATEIARRHSVSLKEVPIGFKYISDEILAGDVLIGGEESGGIAIKGHIPERDGVLMSLLLAEILAKQQKPMSEIIDEMMSEIGYHCYRRLDLHLEDRLKIVERLQTHPPVSIAGQAVTRVETLDGIKLRFKHGWLLLRASGTEPLLRVYSETDDAVLLDAILEEAERFAKGEMELWAK
jgi:phosphomannomutase